jgi:hypothetical protein
MPRNPINYQNTIIYKLVCKDLNILDVYVGHTTDFKRRKSEHKKRCNGSYDKTCNLKVYQSIRDNGGMDNWEMVEIEKFPCKDSNEAIKQERYWYENLNASLNTQKPNRTMQEYCKEWEELNKEKRKLQHKVWEQLNKDKRNEQQSNIRKIRYATDENYKLKVQNKNKEKYICACGANICKTGKTRHEKTPNHLKYLESL